MPRIQRPAEERIAALEKTKLYHLDAAKTAEEKIQKIKNRKTKVKSSEKSLIEKLKEKNVDISKIDIDKLIEQLAKTE
jgi:uncharacterized membrane protein YfhO